MDPFMYSTAWPQHHQTTSQPPSTRALGHTRSFSSVPPTAQSSDASTSSQSPQLPTKSSSISYLPNTALTGSYLSPTLNDEMSTLPDPRTLPKQPTRDDAESPPAHHPDLNGEVATLSTKLIDAINYQTVLDDTLSATRQELAAAKGRIQELEAQNASLRNTVRGDVWVRRSTLDAEKKALQHEKKSMQALVTEEANKRAEVEQEKKKIEQELENLTAALFEEANKMVVKAKEEAQLQHETLQRRIEQLKGQLVDSESLLQSQQEQLTELKQVMENMSSENNEQVNGSAPSSPGAVRHIEKEQEGQAVGCSEPDSPASTETFSPTHPTSLPHLVQPVLRTDLAAYDEFMSLARLSHNRFPSRASSGSFGGFNAMAMGLGGSTSSAHPSNASTTSLTASTSLDKSAPQSPNTPASTVSMSSTTGFPVPPLKESRFYKRALLEDIDPTLRLDNAPGLSWLARRAVLSSIAEGSLVVEPIPASATYIAIAKPQFHPCSLCGESRKESQYLRNHRFKTSEADSAQRYPLCNYCLNRVRSTCDFLGFLRMVRAGHWRADDEDQEKAAWEESVRLRDQMFWARIGGGVVPATSRGAGPSDECNVEEVKTGRVSEDSNISPTAPENPSDKEPVFSTPENQSREDISRTNTILEPKTPPERIESGLA